MIPLCDLRKQYGLLQDEVDEAMQRVAADGAYILGPNVRAFEQEIASYLGCEHAVGVNSGTDALHLALRALGIGPGDEVITTPFTFIATTEAIGMVGAKPVFVDIDPDTYNLDPKLITAAITPQTKAILPVHLYGQPCDMDAIMSIARGHSLRVIEDCAQAIGATYRGRSVGTIGDVGCFSFFPSKNLGCFGDGGMLVTNDAAVHERSEMLRRHGGRVKYHHSELGLNSRLDEIQAAVLRVKLPYLDAWNTSRRGHAYEYNRLLDSLPGITTPAELDGVLTAVYHQYTVRADNRDKLLQHLRDEQIGCAVYYPIPLHLQEVHQGFDYQRGDFPHAEEAAESCLSLPMFPELSQTQLEQVVERVTALIAPLNEAA